MARPATDRTATTVRLPADLVDQLDAVAEARDLSRNQVVTAACRALVASAAENDEPDR